MFIKFLATKKSSTRENYAMNNIEYGKELTIVAEHSFSILILEKGELLKDDVCSFW